jgi:hypothetical protein
MGKYDVVKDFDWTSVPRGSGLRKRAPRVWVKSFKIKSNEALNRFKNYMQVLAITDAKSFYDKMYGDVSEPEDDFNFPFFGDNVRSFSNTYGDTFQSAFLNAADSVARNAIELGGTAASVMGIDNIQATSDIIRSDLSVENKLLNLKTMVGQANGDPGSYIETPKMYQYEQSDGPLTVSFVLSNTINSDWKKNYELVKKLQVINRPFRKNSIAMEPPRIYQVKVPGHRFIRWASCSNFELNLLGTKREIDGIIVPEGFQVTMSFTSLTTEVSNFMDDV